MPTVRTASDTLPPVSDGVSVPPPEEQAVASRAIPAMPATIGASLRVLTSASLHFRWTLAMPDRAQGWDRVLRVLPVGRWAHVEGQPEVTDRPADACPVRAGRGDPAARGGVPDLEGAPRQAHRDGRALPRRGVDDGESREPAHGTLRAAVGRLEVHLDDLAAGARPDVGHVDLEQHRAGRVRA